MSTKERKISLCEEIHDILFKNATVFLNCTIKAVNCGLKNYDNIVAAIVNLQMALELGVKASIVEYFGVKYIVQGATESTTDEEIEELYNQNKLKILEFEQLKNFLKAKNLFDFNKEKYNYMSKFQNYRNKLVHFVYNFSSEETDGMEEDIFYTLVYVLGVIMSDPIGDEDEDRSFMQEYINMDEYNKLMKNSEYVKILEDFVSSEYTRPFLCPICYKRLLTHEKKCLGCIISFSDDGPGFGYIDCKFCKGHKTVIYDKLNISYNDSVRGLCLDCQEDTMVYECPKCHQVVDLEDTWDSCYPPDHCVDDDPD